MNFDYDNNVIKVFAKYLLPIATTLSIIKQTLFYWCFEINIWSYVRIEEILTPFIKDLLFYTLVLVLPVILVVIFHGKTLGEKNNLEFHALKEKPFYKRLIIAIRNDAFFIVPYIILGIALYYKGFPLIEIILKFGFVFAFFFFYFFRNEFLIINEIELNLKNVTILNISAILFGVMVFTITDSFSDAHNIKNKIGKEVKLIVDNKLIYCKYNYNYIGRTNNYTFIYNKEKDRTEVIENSRISKEFFSNSR